MRLKDIIELDSLAPEKAIKAFEFAVICDHLRESDTRHADDTLGNPLQPSRPTRITQLGVRKLVTDRSAREIPKGEHFDLRSSSIGSVNKIRRILRAGSPQSSPRTGEVHKNGGPLA